MTLGRRPPLDADVLAGVRAGDAAALRRVREKVAGIVRHRGYYIPPDEQADVVQDALVGVWRGTAADGFACRNFDGWVRTLACRACVDWMRAHRASEPLAIDVVDARGGPEQELAERERAALGRRILDQMREACRELFRLHAGEGLTYGEIARLQDRTEGGVRTQMYECLKQARRLRQDAETPVPRDPVEGGPHAA